MLDIARRNWNLIFTHNRKDANPATLLGLIGDLLLAVEALQAKVQELEDKNV